jgi:hypothetical protein
VKSYSNFYRAFRQLLAERYPSTNELKEAADLERLASPHRIRLSRKIADAAQAAIKAHYELAQRESFRRRLITDQGWLTSVAPRTNAVLMAYDFHTTEEGDAFLVEVNTNASSFLLSDTLYKAHGLDSGWLGKEALDSLKESFLAEASSFGMEVQRAAIADDDVMNQKMLVEFFMYRDFLAGLGWAGTIAEGARFEYADGKLLYDGQPIQFVYNRLTDFYFQDPRFRNLRQAYLDAAVCVSPHPWAYHLFADKARLVEMSESGWLENSGANAEEAAALRKVLIPTHELAAMGTPDDVWANRKNLFFKPRRSHGGKSVYRGSSVSRKVFERLLEEDTLMQTFVPAQNWKTGDSDSYMENWKFDVRFFVYRDQIQLCVARSYQGQVTNFSSRYGGLTAIEFV